MPDEIHKTMKENYNSAKHTKWMMIARFNSAKLAFVGKISCRINPLAFSENGKKTLEFIFQQIIVPTITKLRNSILQYIEKEMRRILIL